MIAPTGVFRQLQRAACTRSNVITKLAIKNSAVCCPRPIRNSPRDCGVFRRGCVLYRDSGIGPEIATKGVSGFSCSYEWPNRLVEEEKFAMALHPQPGQPVTFAGFERPGPFADWPQRCSLQKEWRRCGKSRCRCARGILHGPYWSLRWRERGRQRRRYVPRERVDAIQVALDQRRRLRPPVWSLRQTLAELRHLTKEIQDARND